MTWQVATGIFIVLMLITGIIWDLVAYFRGGNPSTISRLTLNVAMKFPLVAVMFLLLVGILIGHLLLPQHVYVEVPGK